METLDITAAVREAAHHAGPAVAGLGRGWGRGSGIVVAEGVVLTAPRFEGHPRGPRGRRGPGGPHRHGGGHEHGPPSLTLAGGRVVEAREAGILPDIGLVVLEADTAGITPVAVSAAAAPPALGDPVIALGNPGGRGLRVTHGYVASEALEFEDRRGLRTRRGIEHTAPLPRGSAGGPLLDAEGNLVGVNALRPSPGLILAVWTGPDLVERVRAVVAGTAPRPRTLGVAVAPPHVARRLRQAVGLPDVAGVLVRGVAEGSPAAAAGITSGDLVTAVGGTPVAGVGDLAAAIDAAPSGRPLGLTVVRGTEVRAVEVDLDAEPVT